MKTILNTKFKSRASSHGRLFLRVMVVFSICIGVGHAGIGRLGGGISAFASIFVNDREMNIDTAVITIDGQPAVKADLKLGQVVLVLGDLDEASPSGTAIVVTVEDAVEGPITRIDLDDDQLVVMGQTVLIDEFTVFDFQSGYNSLEDFDIQDQAEVFGFIANDGDIFATRVEQKPSGGPFEVTGVVSKLTATTFKINKLTVTYSANVLVNFPPDNVIMAGDFVEAKGCVLDNMMHCVLGANGELIATSVELKAGVAGNDGELGEFEGLITEFDSASAFSVGRIPVVTYPHTVFEGGGPGNLALDVSVEVEGVFGANGALVADRVIIRGTRIRIHAQVDSKSTTSVTALSITATVDSTTIVEDDSSMEIEPFDVSQLKDSVDFVEVRSFKNPAASTPFLAERVRRVHPQSAVHLQYFEVRLQGFVDVDPVDMASFVIHGVTIYVNQDTRYQNASKDEIDDAADFFAVLKKETFVVVHGIEIANNEVFAAQVELHIND